jgi:hypothetical protein
MAVMITGLTAVALQASVYADEIGCKTSGPASGAYTMVLCLTDPLNGDQLVGLEIISASVTEAGASPGVRRMIFYLDGEYLLTDLEAPYTFELRSERFVDGLHRLEVEALMRDNFVTDRAGIDVVFNNGTTEPPVNTNTFAVAPGTTPLPGQPFVAVAVGDGAGGESPAGQVTDLIATLDPNLFLYLGDVYEKGTPTEFFNWYGTSDRFFGRFRAITNPTIGNHEYEGAQAGGYFDYWDNIPNFYSFDAAGWHFISLNSTSQFGQTTPGTPQYDWLVQDLSANPAICTIVYFHHPVYGVGPQGDTPRMNDIWSLLAQHGVDVVLTGHDHSYQRWHPLDGAGQRDPSGITQFVVGSGGHGIQGFVRSDSRLAAGFGTVPMAYGALRLELKPTATVFQFINIDGNILDSGVIPCSGAPRDTTPPSPPTNLMATANPAMRVDLTWSPATDDTGVAGYTIFRDGQALATVNGATPRFSDTDVTFLTPYTYTVEAFDPAGNRSGRSNTVTVTTPATGTFTLTPVADAYVSQSQPTGNFGAALALRTDDSPKLNTYLRFDTRDVAGTIVTATLQVFAETGSLVGYDVHGVADNSWDELTINFDNAPAFGSAVGSSGPFGAGELTLVDVTPLITSQGLVSLAMTTSSSIAVRYSSREAGVNAPQLILQTIPVEGVDCKPCNGGVTHLTLKYNGTAPAAVAVKQRNGDTVFGPQVVNPGEVFSFSGTEADNKFGSEITVFVDGAAHVRIDTSCAQIIGPGLVAGAFEVVAGRSKDNGTLCPLFGDCNSSPASSLEIKKNKVKWGITNAGSDPLVIRRIELTWPAGNGKLKKVKLNGDIFTQQQVPPSTTIESGWAGNLADRTIKPGETKKLEFEFQNNAGTNQADYQIRVTFMGDNCAIQFVP